MAQRLTKPGRLAAVAALVLLVAGILLWLQADAPAPALAPIAEPAADVSSSQAAPTDPEPPEVAAETSVDARADKDPPDLEAGSPELVEDEPQPGPRRVVIEFRDTNGDPVRHWGFKYVLEERQSAPARAARSEYTTPWQRLASDDVSVFGAPPTGVHGAEAVTDEDGNFELLEGRDFPDGLAIRFGKLYDFAPGMTYAWWANMHDGLFTFSVPRNAELTTVRVRLAMAQTVVLNVRYADGEPFTEAFGLTFGSQRPGSLARVALSEQGSAEIILPQDELRMYFFALSSRTGFRTDMMWQVSAHEIPATLELVIPADEDQTTIVVDLTAWPSDQPVTVGVFHSSGIAVTKQSVQGGGVWQTHRVRAAPGLRVIVLSDATVWQGPEFELRAGESAEFTAVPTQTFSVGMTFVDESGAPVTRVRVSPFPFASEGAGRVPPAAQRAAPAPDYVMRRGGRGGRIVMDALPAGEITLHILSDWHEPQSRTVVGRPGDQIELGNIVLVAARGTITVRLTNYDPETEYYLLLWHPGLASGSVLQSPVEGNTYVIRNVNVREYTLGVFAPSISTAVKPRMVRFNGDVAEVDIDVNNLPRPD
jgi:hypothetical protein